MKFLDITLICKVITPQVVRKSNSGWTFWRMAAMAVPFKISSDLFADIVYYVFINVCVKFGSFITKCTMIIYSTPLL